MAHRLFRSAPGLMGVLGLALFLSSSTAAAQARLSNGGMDLRLFRPAVDSKGLVGVDGVDVLGEGDVSFGLVLDGGFGLVPFEGFVNDATAPAEDAERVDRLVEQLFTATLQASYGIGNVATVGLQVPVLAASGPNVTVPGQWNDGAAGGGLDQQGIGDVVLHGKLRLLRAERAPIGVAAIVQLGVPTGAEDRFGGEPGAWLWPSLVFEWRPVRPLRVALQAGYRVTLGDGATLRIGGRTMPGGGNATGAQLAPGAAGDAVTWGDVITLGGGASLRVLEPVDVVVEGSATQLAGAVGEQRALSAEGRVGLKIFVERNSFLTLAGGLGASNGVQAPDLRAIVGFVFEPSIGDRDGDGLRDDADDCPAEPEDWDGFLDNDGCPDLDDDRDGILDVEDACPRVPEDRDGDADDDGCPDSGVEDRDADSILDAADGCPDDPEDRDGFADDDGCPDPDNDEDRILDVDDLCPDEPEHYNGHLDADGCHDEGDLEVDDGGIILFKKIQFATDSARILPESYPLLDSIAAAMQGHAEITLVEIQGHADERASDAYNLRLTRDRAHSVMDALVTRGVAPERMRAAGYGERCPLDAAHTPAAWERNRRVEIQILRTIHGPTGAEVSCPGLE